MVRCLNNEYSAVLDTCVLAPMPLCDTLLLCAEGSALYRPLWSAETLVELRRTLQKFGRSAAQIERRLQFMREAFPEACVQLLPGQVDAVVEIPDPGDRHLIAAAIQEHAQAIVTFNLRHFPQRVLEPHGIQVLSPDAFLVHQFHLNPMRMLEILDAQAGQIRQTKAAVLERLKTGLPEFVALVGGL
jgi:predicted nucleic acid-binding protein